MSNERLRRELKKGLPDPLYFIWGKDSFFLEDLLLKAIEAVVDPSQRDFNYDQFSPTASPQQILDTASTLPMLASRRMVVLRDFHELLKDQIKPFINYFKNPCNTTCMLILSQKKPKAGIDFGRHVYEIGIRESDIPSWLKTVAADKGLKLSEDAVDYLIEAVGTNAGLLSSEIEKLSLSGLKTFEAEDIITRTGITREFTSFNLVDALVAGQKLRAFRILKSLMERKSFDAAGILGALNWHYRQFYDLWENKGKRPLKMRSATYNMLLKYLPAFTGESFRSIFQCLHEADLGIKSSGRPEIALELLLIRLLRGTQN